MRQTEYWRALLGVHDLLLLVLAFPQGIVGAFSSIWRKARREASGCSSHPLLSKAFVHAVNNVSFQVAKADFWP